MSRPDRPLAATAARTRVRAGTEMCSHEGGLPDALVLDAGRGGCEVVGVRQLVRDGGVTGEEDHLLGFLLLLLGRRTTTDGEGLPEEEHDDVDRDDDRND